MKTFAKQAILTTQNSEPLSIVQLQLIASFLMTEFNKNPNPKISHFIVRHLYLLIDHPEVAKFSDCKKCYLQLQMQWQRTTEKLLEGNENDKPPCQPVH